ncbi:MAG: response regulator transcription factor [Bacteroidota bacterium]
MTRILLVDDHPLLRQGIAITIEAEPDFEVVGQAGDAEEAIGLVSDLRPDLVISDISLPGMNGLELLKNLLAQRPDLPVLIVSRHDEDLYAERAIRAGARGYVSKVAAGDQIVSAIRRVLRGGIHLSEELKDKMLFGAASGAKDATQTPLEVLSDRELEVFEMTGRGLPTREISERLHLSVKTVESYRSRIKTKLGLANGTELIKHAVAWVEGEGAGR